MYEVSQNHTHTNSALSRSISSSVNMLLLAYFEFCLLPGLSTKQITTSVDNRVYLFFFDLLRRGELIKAGNLKGKTDLKDFSSK